MKEDKSACKTVTKGGVGESGASVLLTHTVTGPTSKIILLRNVGTFLCANTGAVGLLAVNGVPVASGPLTAQGSLIQAEADPGAHVAAVVHTIPLFNGILCVRLGELNLQLDECDLVTASDFSRKEGVICKQPPATRDWFAWNNFMPPKPDDFHVVGEVQVPNPGVDLLLVPRNPQGINPHILLLDLILVQRPGLWIQIPVWKSVRYDKYNASYTSVQIFACDQVIANVPVEEVQ
ncbi:MAG TPA: hypothetical protein VHR66_26040 [Gemmataceae bacterium]|nr:hypothetical protein [Gemmataceae bacterium]